MLSSVALTSLQQYMAYEQPEKWMFPGQRAGPHLTDRSVQKIFEKAKDAAGIKSPLDRLWDGDE